MAVPWQSLGRPQVVPRQSRKRVILVSMKAIKFFGSLPLTCHDSWFQQQSRNRKYVMKTNEVCDESLSFVNHTRTIIAHEIALAIPWEYNYNP